jgi:hypothetical protein
MVHSKKINILYNIGFIVCMTLILTAFTDASSWWINSISIGTGIILVFASRWIFQKFLTILI